MKYRNDPSVSGFQQPFGGQHQFPGIPDPFFNGGMGGPLIPFNPAMESNMPQFALQPTTEVIPKAASAKGGGFSLANLGGSLKDLQGIVDRMGGLDGILTTMTKVQKVVGSVQQMAPLIKLLAGSLKKGSAATASDDGDAGLSLPKRRRRRRRTTKGSGASSGRSRKRKRKR
ncbi:hypothetical protein [Paenibacillus spongiae]|uniref:Tyrosine protein kinase n=1 Tax=Paenibacillus spongiae TaxID=2909671 RepID=A0ABY5SAI6_9BACL|nr:hypothetical protein [Paenibacillus spongiae]UVI30932.1 hypothetical protein L1F29_03415 [Paenibacillus spongiae]